MQSWKVVVAARSLVPVAVVSAIVLVGGGWVVRRYALAQLRRRSENRD